MGKSICAKKSCPLEPMCAIRKMRVPRLENVLLKSLLSLCVFMPTTASAEPEYFLLESNRPAHISPADREIDPANLELSGIVLGTTTISEVMQKLGPAELIHVGHDGALICYRSADQKDDAIVTFGAETHAEQRVINFQLIADGMAFKAHRHCVPSMISTKLSTKNGLTLGQTVKTIKMILGEPVLEWNGSLLQEFDHHKPTTYDGQPACLEVFSSVAAQFHNDRLSWLLVTRNTEGYRGPCIRNQHNRQVVIEDENAKAP